MKIVIIGLALAAALAACSFKSERTVQNHPPQRRQRRRLPPPHDRHDTGACRLDDRLHALSDGSRRISAITEAGADRAPA